jgi:Carboxypeptidase regulatory-like domain
VLSLLFGVLFVGVMVVGSATDSVMVPLAGAMPTNDLPAASTDAVVVSKRNRMHSGIDAGNPQTQSLTGVGVLVGRVTVGPLSPVERSGEPRALTAVPGARLVISGVNAQESTSVVTDADGRYRVRLAPGSYSIEMAPLASGRFTKDLPVTVTITEGQELRLDVRVDTGVR